MFCSMLSKLSASTSNQLSGSSSGHFEESMSPAAFNAAFVFDAKEGRVTSLGSWSGEALENLRWRMYALFLPGAYVRAGSLVFQDFPCIGLRNFEAEVPSGLQAFDIADIFWIAS